MAILDSLRMNSNLVVETKRGKITELVVLFANIATAMMEEFYTTVREW